MKYFSFTRYDVWLVDWRTSCNLPLTQVESRYTLDDCAAYDYPAAIDKVLEVTNKVISNISYFIRNCQPQCNACVFYCMVDRLHEKASQIFDDTHRRTGRGGAGRGQLPPPPV